MAKLHELLAVESDLKALFAKILPETIATFTKREDHFKGFTRHLDWYAEDVKPIADEEKSIDTTVYDKLTYQAKHVIRYLDAVLQKETTNQTAVANIEVNGIVLAENIPAGFLLGLEKHLVKIRDTYLAIPTLPPGIDWELDEKAGPNIYKRRRPKEEYKTEKAIVPQILYPATVEHPAQVDKISETRNVGLYTRNEWCSMISPAEKHVLLDRIDALLAAVKKARQRANNAVVQKVTIGKKLFEFIHGK